MVKSQIVVPLTVLLAFVDACGGDREEWERRWRELRTSADVASGMSPGSSSLSSDAGPPSGSVPSEDGARSATATVVVTAPPPPPRLGRWPLIVALVISLLVAATTTTLLFQVYGPALFAHGGPGAVDPVADGSDPNRAGCGPGAGTMGHVPVYFPGNSYAGELELRYSPRCHAAWARFQPAKTWNPGTGMVVTVWTVRPADQSTQQYSVPFNGVDIIGNMLMTGRGCILIEVTMVQADLASPVATVSCQQLG